MQFADVLSLVPLAAAVFSLGWASTWNAPGEPSTGELASEKYGGVLWCRQIAFVEQEAGS
jgi:hypothetical protein